MSSLNQLISEIATTVGQPNNHALRENIKSIILHTRNELIRHSMESHGYVDSALQQKYKVSLIEIEDEMEIPPILENIEKVKIKRTTQKVPRPVRLTNNLPFTRVSSVGTYFNQEIPYVKETSNRFRKYLPGMRGCVCYDYINEYIYVYPAEQILSSPVEGMSNIVIEAAFENPTLVARLSGEGAEFEFMDDDNEWFIPEDMIGQLKDIVLKRDLLANVRRETNETPNTIKVD